MHFDFAAPETAMLPIAESQESTTRLIVFLTAGDDDDGKRATLAFSAACAARAVGMDSVVFLVGDGLRWANRPIGESVQLPGLPSLETLVAEFEEDGGEIYACSACHGARAEPCDTEGRVMARRTNVSPAGFASLFSGCGANCVTF